MGKSMDLTGHARFTANPVTSSGKNHSRAWDSVSYSLAADIHQLHSSMIAQLFATYDRRRN